MRRRTSGTLEEGPEPLAAVGAVSLLVSRSLGSCRCLVEGGWCGMHRLEPAVDTGQGQATWTAELADAALVAAGSRVSTDVRRKWADDLLAGLASDEPADDGFRLGLAGRL